MESAKSFSVGSQVWLAGEKDTWRLGEVVSRNGSVIKVKPEDGGSKLKLDIKKEKKTLYPANRSVVGDMTSLQFFNVPGILHNLKMRAIADEPYTFLSGSVLVAVNPLQRIEDPKDILGKPKAVNVPHPYAIAESAFQQLVFNSRRSDGSDTPVDQSIIVGGESGAGKTESSKYVLKHLVSRSVGSKDDNDLDQRLIDSNPILEAFGNASTKRNHNSSRFGKFMKLHFKGKKKKSDSFKIFGASVNTYLLERSRVTYHVKGERTYHVFYQLVNGADKKLRKRLKLGDTEFEYLKPKQAPTGHGANFGGKSKASKSDDTHLSHLPGPDVDKADFKELCNALGTIGASAENDPSDASGGVFEVVAAILHLGNVKFVEKDSSEGNVATVKDQEPLEIAAKLLGLKASKLLKVFTEHRVKTVGDEVVKKRDAKGAKFALDAVVKFVYIGLFDWLVKCVTVSLSENGSLDDLPFIGVLDIFGFETFKINDFEQLLINFTNEALQSCFNQQIFQAEAQLYEKEGLLVDEKDRQLPPDNIECVALLQGGNTSSKKDKSKEKTRTPGLQIGILGMIDSEGRNPQAHDDKLNSALHRTFKGNEYFPRPHPKDTQSCFIVKHYAGKVKYTVGSFLVKNTDNLPNEVGKVFKSSSVGAIKAMFKGKNNDGSDDSDGKSGKKKKKNTSVAGKFKAQMEQLIGELNMTRCAFIRCIKPNASMTRKGNDSWFDPSYVMPQLINLSIPQTAEVLQGGLPTRVEFQLFIDSYSELLPKESLRAWKRLGGSDEKRFVKALFYAFEIEPSSYKLGMTRVFFKSGMLEKVNEVLSGSTSGKKLDKVIVKRFKQSFARALWRNAYAKVLAYVHFQGLLMESRKRGAATILQRLARRRIQEMEAKQELARLRAEKEKELALEAEIAAEKAKKKLKALKKQKDKATKFEQEGLAEEEVKTQGILEEHTRRAKHHSMRVMQNRKKEDEFRKSVGHMLSSGGMLRIKDRRQTFRKSVAQDFQLPSDDDDESDEEEPPFIVEAVAYKRVLPVVEPKGERNRDKSASSSLASFQENRPAAASVLSKLACFNSIFKSRRPSSGSSASSSTHARTNITSAVSEEEKQSSSRTGLSDSNDGWQDCILNITGFQIRLYDDGVLEDLNQISGQATRVVQIDDTLDYNKADPEQDDSQRDTHTCIALVRNTGLLTGFDEFMRLSFEDPYDADNFIETLSRAQKRFKYELEEASKFESGQLTSGMIAYQELFDAGHITKSELELALFQQVSGEHEYLDEIVGNYGPDAYADYKTQCPSCFEFIFNLPAEPLSACPHCNFEDIDPPEQLDQEARLARMKQEDSRAQIFEERDAGDLSFPFPFVGSDGVKYIFDMPRYEAAHNGTSKVGWFKMEWHAQTASGEEWDDYVFLEPWESMKEFFESGLKESDEVERSVRKMIPKWPSDPPEFNTLEEELEYQFPEVCRFFSKFLDVVRKENLMDVSIIRAFLGSE